MTGDSRTMRRRQKSFILKVLAGSLVCLLLFRVDFLGLLSVKLLGQSWGSSNNGLSDDRVCVKGQCVHRGVDHSFLRKMVHHKPGVAAAAEPGCGIPQLKSTIQVQPDRDVQCVRSPVSKASCKVAHEMFGDIATSTETQSCRHQGRTEHCQIKYSGGRFHVDCTLEVCSKQKQIQLGVFSEQTASYQWKAFSTAEDLENAILDLTWTDNPGYCIVSCVPDRALKSHDNNSPLVEELGRMVTHPQIVNLPPNMPHTYLRKSQLDFNIVFIDSVSRHHFFRTLPQSVAALESLAPGGSSYSFATAPVVLDYTLVQGVRSRTFETLQTMFSGFINPFEKTFGVQAMPSDVLKTNVLLTPLQKLGYKTLWLEDLCPLWEWGLSKDLLVYDKDQDKRSLLKNLRTALDKAGIESLGNTFSNCLLLNSNGVPDPFHGPEKICFNGQHHHEYQFDYLRMFQETMLAGNQSFFTFLETNIGHEPNAVRIAQLDVKLAEYINFVKSMTNTITVFMADHGNAYGKFFDRSPEGRTELYQPFIFIVIPENVQRLITEPKMRSLLKNQFKLVSVLDLHYMLSDLIDSLHSSSSSEVGDKTFTDTVYNFNQQFHVTNRGLMGNISESRSCSVMPRIMPNLCICEGYEVKRSKYSYYTILALYSMGELNNEIQRLKRAKAATSVGGFHRCVRLKLATEPVKNIQENQDQGNSKSITMDIHISTPVQRQAEVFFVALQVTHGNQGKLVLQNYDRVSIFGKYAVCADEDVTLSLCICDLDVANSDTRHSVIYNNTYKYYLDVKHLSDAWKDFENLKLQEIAKNILHKDLDAEVRELEVEGEKCVGIVMQSNDAGVVVEAISVCRVTVILTVNLKTSGLALSMTGLVEQRLYPGDVNFLIAGVTTEEGIKWSWEMNLSHRIVTA